MRTEGNKRCNHRGNPSTKVVRQGDHEIGLPAWLHFQAVLFGRVYSTVVVVLALDIDNQLGVARPRSAASGGDHGLTTN